ncbi:MAG: hypothetical protein EXR93_10810 [Gemmatimonadetes bacterium]|nr:hypothetical protein [Gemmatimonadota bacterium]
MAARGRHWLAVWLVFALGVLAWVVARQTAAHVLATKLNEVRTERSVLEGRRAELLRRIRAAGSRAVLTPRARALGLRLPADTDIIILQVPTPERP